MKTLFLFIILSISIQAQFSFGWWDDGISPPTLLASTNSTDSIFLTWTDPSSLDSVYILKSYDGSTYALYDTVDAGVQAYSDSSTTAHQTKYYALQAVKSRVVSDTSNVVSDFTTTNWYVSTDDAGDSTGTSWANVDSLGETLHGEGFAWTQVLAGDTVFIDGGTDSLVYPRTVIQSINGTATDYIVITAGKDDTHNGRVIFKQDEPLLTYPSSFTLGTSTYTKIINLEFSTLVEDENPGLIIVKFSGGSDNIIDSCIITSNGNGFGLYFDGEDRLTARYNTITTLSNTLEWGQDCIWLGGGEGGHTITHNVLNFSGNYSSEAHSDIIQMSQEGSTNNYLFTIAYNFMRALEVSEPSCQGIYADGLLGNRFLIYNNIISMGTQVNLPIGIYGANSGEVISVKMYNNTILSGNDDGGAGGALADFRYIDTLDFRNNFLFSDSLTTYPLVVGYDNFSDVDSINIDYNQYFTRDGIDYIATPANGTPVTWTAWRALGYDTHSDTTGLALVDTFSTTDTDYKLADGSSGIDEGTTLTLFTDDYDSTARPVGSFWDIGAFERTLSAPTLAVTGSAGKITLTTSGANGCDSVRIYRDTTDNPTVWVYSIAPTATKIDTPLTADIYFYRGKAYNSNGAISGYSASVNDTVTAPAGVDYEFEIDTLIANLVTPLADSQLVNLNDFVVMLKDSLSIDSLADKFDVMYVLANETEESALRNLVKNANNATAVNSPTFAAFEGYTGANTKYLNTNYNPTTHAVRFSQNSASFGIYSRTNRDSANVGNGTYTQPRLVIFPRTTANLQSHYINTNSGVLTSISGKSVTTGMMISSRTAANEVRISYNSTYVTDTDASTGIADADIYLLATSGTLTYDTIQMAFAFIGNGLTQTEMRQIMNCIEAYLDGIGKGVL